MPYVGSTYKLPLTSGVSFNPDFDQLPPTALTEANNVNLHNGGVQPRGGSGLVNSSPIGIGPTNIIKGISQFIPESGQIVGGYLVDESANYFVDELGNRLVDEHSDILVCTLDGNIWKNYATLLKSGLTLNSDCSFEEFYGSTYITNGNDIPQVYNNAFPYTYDLGSPTKPTAVLGSGAGYVDDGVHYYKITYVSASGESTLGIVSDIVTVAAHGTNGKVELTNIPVSINSSCTGRNIYRTKAGGTTYYLVHSITDNTTTLYTDNTADFGITIVAPTDSTAFIPTDWQAGYPKYFVKHGRGMQQRLCAFGCEGYPNRFYMSVNQESDFGDKLVTVLSVLTKRLTGAIEIDKNLFLFNDNKTFVLNDADATVANWGIESAVWEGGTANNNLIVRTPSDVFIVSPNMNIFSISTTQKYGDFEIGSISKPVYLHKWVEDNVDVSQMNKFFARYDLIKRAIKIFVVLKGETAPTMCLVYFIDKTPETGWSKHTFDLNYYCSALIQKAQYEWSIYTGGDNGSVYELESDTLRDNGQIYESKISTTPLTLDNPRTNKQFDKDWVVMKPRGTESLAVDVTIDDRVMATRYLIMTGLNDLLQNYSILVGATGKREQITITSSDGKDYFLSQILLDFKNLQAI